MKFLETQNLGMANYRYLIRSNKHKLSDLWKSVIIIRFVNFDVQSEGKQIAVHDDKIWFAVLGSIAFCDLFISAELRGVVTVRWESILLYYTYILIYMYIYIYCVYIKLICEVQHNLHRAGCREWSVHDQGK